MFEIQIMLNFFETIHPAQAVEAIYRIYSCCLIISTCGSTIVKFGRALAIH